MHHPCLHHDHIISRGNHGLALRYVLDDEADLVDLTTDRLTKLGFPAVGTTSPQDALQKIRLGGCRAVIADFKMPGMDGLAFLEKVLQYDPGIYVILVTGY